MKFEKIAQFISSKEKVIARIKPKVGFAMRSSLLIVGITELVILSPFLYFVFTGNPAVFYFMLGIFGFSSSIVVLALFSNYKRMVYVITTKNLFIPAGRQLMVIPIKGLIFLNEKKLREKKMPVGTLKIKPQSREIIPIGFMGVFQSAPLGLAQISGQAALRYGNVALQGIENPEKVMDTLQELSVPDIPLPPKRNNSEYKY